MIYAISSNLKTLLGQSRPISWLLVYFIPVLFLIIFFPWHRKIRDLSLSFVLLILALVPYVWYFIASNHSAIHIFMTYRIQAVTIMSVLCAMYYAINWPKIIIDMNKILKSMKSA